MRQVTWIYWFNNTYTPSVVYWKK